MAMHNSEFDKNLDFSREFAEEIYPRPWSIFEISLGQRKIFKNFPWRVCPLEISKIALGLG